MIRARGSVLMLAALVLLAAAAFAVSRSHEARPARPAGKPELLLLTSLPLVFGESFSLKAAGSPALDALESRYRVLPISITSPIWE